MLLQGVPAQENAGKGQKRLVDVGPLLVANPQAAKLIKPSEGSFHHPAPSPQSTAMFGVALGEPRNDVATTQTLPDCLRVITAVA